MTVNPTIQSVHQQFVEQLLVVQEEREARAIARIVFEDALGIHNFARQDELGASQLTLLEEIAERLLQNEPIQYILGQADFFGLSLRVTPAVLIPRPETEELVYWIAECIRKDFVQTNLKVLDIGTGSGCIPIALKAKVKELDVHALDVSMEALAIASENARLQQCWVNFRQVDILNEAKWGELGDFDLIVSNPPYIPTEEKTQMPQQVLAHEPALALFVSNEDPLIFYRTIGQFAKQKLKLGGQLFFETNEHNAKHVVAMLYAIGFKAVDLEQDMSGKDRMIKASL